MVVMPVSTVNTAYSVSNSVSFGRKNRIKEGDTEGSPVVNHSKKASNLAKVPVVVVMAMSPAMMNAKLPNGLPALDGAKTELLAALPSSEASAAGIPIMTLASAAAAAQPPQKTYASEWERALDRSSDILYRRSFMQNGQKYNMVFSNARYQREKGKVHDIYVFPQNYKDHPDKQFPLVRELIYHDLGKDKEFCGVIIQNVVRQPNGDYKETLHEMRLPDEAAQAIIDLLANDFKYTNGTLIKYSETKSPNLRKTVTDTY